jgi:serine/threonine protein kinase
VLKDFIRLMAEVLDCLARKKIVHADLKPDNILIDFDGKRITALKLIDFGSAFSFMNASNITATTPEYLAPEVLQYLECRS